MFLDMTIKHLFINLKVLSQLQPHGKLQRSSDGVLRLDSDHPVYTSVKRFLFSESRKRCIKDITMIVEEAEEKARDSLNSKYMDCSGQDEQCESLREQIIALMTNIENACMGLSNLRNTTYSRDAITSSELEILIARLSSVVSKIRRAL